MIHVVVGILFNEKREVLVAQRQQHKFQGGRWEFPGGKVEQHENGFDALQRELHEEIDIQVISAKSFQEFKHTYVDKVILLDVWIITEFSGEPYGKEGQETRWVSLSNLSSTNIPDANREIVEMLIAEADFLYAK